MEIKNDLNPEIANQPINEEIIRDVMDNVEKFLTKVGILFNPKSTKEEINSAKKWIEQNGQRHKAIYKIDNHNFGS